MSTASTAYTSAAIHSHAAAPAHSGPVVGPQVTTPALPAPRSQVEGVLRSTLTCPTAATAVIAVAGELDLATAPRLAEILTARPALAARNLIVDLSKTTFLSCAGLGVLADAQRRAQATGQDLRIVTGPRCVHRILQLTGLDREWRCYPVLTAALAAGPGHDSAADYLAGSLWHLIRESGAGPRDSAPW